MVPRQGTARLHQQQRYRYARRRRRRSAPEGGISLIAAGSLVAVTGATGFIGSTLCQSLLDRGYRVRALARNPAAATQLAAIGVTLVEGDLADSAALERLIADSDAVVHAAGAVRGSCQGDFDRVNVDGTAAVIRAIRGQTRKPRLLLLSSIVAREPNISWYAHSKWQGEQLLGHCADIEYTVLRPPAVYGPGDKEMLPIFQLMRRGFAIVPGSPEARISLIYVSDLVAAIIACLLCPAALRQPLSLGDGKPNGYNWHELAEIAGQHWSRRVRLLRVPKWLLDAIASVNNTIAGITGTAPMLTPPKVRELRHSDWVTDNSAITAATGWTPAVGLSKGLEQLKLPSL